MKNSILINFSNDEIYVLEYILTKVLEERINFPEVSDQQTIINEIETNQLINDMLIKIAQAKLDTIIPKFDN